MPNNISIPGAVAIAILVVLVLIVIVRNIYVVQQSKAYVVERLGAFHSVWGVGLHLKVPFIERVVKKVSLKEQVADFDPQPVITKDNVTMQIDTVIYFQITDPKLYTYGVEYPMNAIENLTATTLRNIIGELELDQSLTSRDTINAKMRAILDEIDRISQINPVTGQAQRVLQHVAIYPASHYVTTKDKMERAAEEIEKELAERKKWFEDHGKLIEAQRIDQRTRYDLEMMRELGYCTGIENYSRVISGREPGSPPTTLLDYFPEDFLLFVDESHVTLPQVRAMYNGDRARKESLVEYGFRLPCAFDNRPLKFPEFEERYHQAVFVSATPGDYEREHADQVAEQVIRPTGLLDPRVEVRPVEGQIDDLVDEIRLRIERNERTLVTTLTKRMAEDLTDHMKGLGLRVRYMHSDVAAIQRMEIIRDLRLGEFDVLVGINLLREGLDLPEVSLVAILDADKEGFLRSETSLIQTIGRAARNAQGLVILYADTVTPSMRAAMDETERRREKQDAYNKAHGIVPQTIRKDVRKVLEISKDAQQEQQASRRKLTDAEREATIRRLEKEMKEASKMLEFEYAALLRDQIIALRGEK